MVNENRNEKNKMTLLILLDIHKHKSYEKLLIIAISKFDNIPCWDEN